MTLKKTKKTVRQDRILAELDSNPAIRVNELADNLEVSPETIRRDLSELDEAGRINRTYGGAVRSQVFEPALTERLKLHIEERQRIAAAAVAATGDAESLFIGGGATTLQFARALRSAARPMTVITPAFSIATELSSNPLIQVMSLPGIVEAKEGLVQGPETLAAIQKYRTPIAVVGASGIDAGGVSEALLPAAQVYSEMIASAEKTLILADSSKYNRRALQRITQWSPRIHLICDTEPTGELAAALDAAGAIVLVAPPR